MAHVDSGQLPAGNPEFVPRTRAERRRLEEQQAKRHRRRDRPSAPPPSGRRGRRDRKKPLPFWQEFPALILIAIVLALLIKTFLVQAFYIPSESMQNTLQVRDRVLVNKLVYDFRGPRRGEVIVFNGVQWQPEVPVSEPGNPLARGLRTISSAVGLGPPNEKDYIKRVIGLPGDTVACCDTAGRVTVNDRPLDEPYILDNTPEAQRAFGPVKVPAGRLWVMGDHRGVSADSRAHEQDKWHGTIPIANVVGRAFVIVWPVGRAGGLPVPSALQHSALHSGADPPGGGSGVLRAIVLPALPLLPIGAVAVRRRRRR
ncbi:MAG: signal peptidase I [Mycobacteriales bacterium]